MPAEPDCPQLELLIAELTAVRAEMLRHESSMTAQIERLHPAYQASTRNLVHYLAFRRHDLRPLQEKLSRLGLSSLGRVVGRHGEAFTAGGRIHGIHRPPLRAHVAPVV